jgi:uncharacterized protein (DUF169 family)
MFTLYVGSQSDRGYLDEADRMTILHKVSQPFDSFTIQDATGYFRGKRENTMLFRIATDNIRGIVETAVAIRIAIGLEGVGIECGGYYHRAVAGVEPEELIATIEAQLNHKA